jgi:Malectin domain/MBG domain (YGX type)
MRCHIPKSIPGTFKSRLSLAVLILWAAASFTAPASVRAQAPDFGPNVKILDPSMSAADIQSTLDSVNAEAQFSTNRYQVFFMPGTYSPQAQVGYYEAVAGLGQSPQSVTINGYLTANLTDSNGNVTDNFWRSLENLTINAPTVLQWAVSQGADFRRMNINGPLQLTNTNCGFASGGFISDTLVTGNVNPCSQQQWYTRNSTIGSWSGGVWNMVFSGVQGAPVPQYPTGNRYTVLPTTPVSREKAFLYVDGNGAFNVFVPDAQRNSSGATWVNGNQSGYSLPISTFFIAKPSTALADINNALLLGQNLILTPGIYQYAGSINITNPNTIVLGLGYATLVPQNGTPAITVADVDGVQIAGLMIDAGPISSPVLVQVGTPGAPGASHHDNPTWISDVSFRIGGAANGLADTSLEIDSSDVILDNTWIWRADHGQVPVGWTVNVANHGLVVNGDNVTALGLAVEHFEQNQVVWNGNAGETIFYQSELPYDVPSQSAWMNGNANGYSSYSVSSQVTSHAAYGLGVYSFFNQGLPIILDSAITVPDATGVIVNDAVSVFLNGSGSITHTVNNAGTMVQSGNITSYVTLYQGVPCSTTCPATPTALTATSISPTQINLAWTASSTPGVLYSVYRSTTSSFTPSTANQIITGMAGLSYADTTASPSSTYYYLVQATGTVGTSAPSNLASAATAANGGKITTDVLKIDSGYTGTTPPAGWSVDGGFTGASTPGSSTTHAITIPSSILNPAPAAVYQTNRRTNGGSFTYTAPGLTPGGSYIVDLHFSDNFSTAAKQRQFNVAINGTQVLNNFDIFATAGGEFTATVQSFYAVADTNGVITIQFSNGAANNAQINGIEIGLGTVPVPVAPSGLAASTLSDTQINLNWTASSTSNAVYELFRSNTPGFQPSPSTLVTTTANTSFTDTALTPGTTYYYIVEANNSILTSLPSNQATAATQSSSGTSPTAPTAPTALKASVASSREIDLLWTGSSTHSVTYQLFRSTTSGFTPSSANLVITTSATGYSDIGLTEATAYYYVVEATNTNGSSSPSNQVTAQTGGPGSITAVSGSGQTAQVGTAFANPLVVSVQDAESNPIAGVTVTFAGTGLTFPSGATAITDGNGQAQVAAQPSSSGTLTISASVDGLSAPASFSETGTAIPQTITFSPLSQVTYGAGPITLSATASSNLPVSFTVSGPATVSGSVLTITGAGQITVTANQAGDTTYAAASPVSQSFTVAQAASTITWAAPAAITYGTPLSAAQLNATASIPGTFTYSPASGILPAGAQTLSVTFTPNDTANYTTITTTVVLQVNRATATITWATPATIIYGTPLSASQLNATASVPGSFTYSPAPGIILGAGAQTLSATFTPADLANYNTANASVLQRVNPAVLTVTANSLSAPFGSTPTLGATITGFVNGDNSSVISGAPALATTANALSLPGTYPITIGTGSLSAVNYIFSFVGGTYTVTFTGSVPAAGAKCNGAYNGAYNGNITVSANQVCVFVGGSVSGNLTQSNGTVELVQTSLGGNLQISGGTFSITSGTIIGGNLAVQSTQANSATNHICGTTVKGDLALQSNGAPVLIGTTDGSCPGNTVHGNVTVQSNNALISVLGNTISDNLTVQSNSASTVVTGNTLQGNLVDQNNTANTQIFTNKIRGNLQCSGNTSITGGSNVAALKQGQCANF